MGRVMPDDWIDISIVVLFLLIGIVMEITLALSSLSEERQLHYRQSPETQLPDDYIPLPAAETTEEEPSMIAEKENDSVDEVYNPLPNIEMRAVPFKTNRESFKLGEASDTIRERKGYGSEEIIAYIDAAYEDNRLKPDSEVEGISQADCAGIREYLQSFKLRGKIIVEETDGVYQVRLDKESLKKFIALQCSVQRV